MIFVLTFTYVCWLQFRCLGKAVIYRCNENITLLNNCLHLSLVNLLTVNCERYLFCKEMSEINLCRKLSLLIKANRFYQPQQRQRVKRPV